MAYMFEKKKCHTSTS